MIVIAEVRDTPYNIVLFLHILSALVAFSPAFVNPVLSVFGRKEAPQILAPLAGLQAKATTSIYLPALVLAGVLGVGMIMMSDDIYKFSQMWVSIAFLGWIAVGCVVLFGILPAEKALVAGDAAAEKKISMFGGIGHLLLAVVLYAMVFKPGL